MDVVHAGQGLRNADSPLSTKIHILWAAKLSPLHRKLSFNVLREICGYIGDVQKLIAVRNDQVLCFDVGTSQWQQLCALRKEINVNSQTSSTFIAPTTIFVCGGGEDPSTCHIVNRAYMLEADGSVQELSHMSVQRGFHGIIWDSDRKALYVFGGRVDRGGTCYTDLSASEMFLSNEWSPLPDMHHGRSEFNPCWHSCLVYLCGGRDANSVESYDPQSNAFAFQDFTLPECGWTTAVVECGVLTVISQNHISKWQQGSLTAQHQRCYTWSACTPVVSEGAVYVCFSLTCRCIDLTTGRMKKSVNLH